jgi:hypothetical protein
MTPILLSALLLFGSLAHAADDENGSCGPNTLIEVDCKKHIIGGLPGFSNSSDNPAMKIDCGKNGSTPSGTGLVGELHSGPVVKDGVKIKGIGNMEATGKVFHLPSGAGRAGASDDTANDEKTYPQGVDTSRGCIHVSAPVLRALKKCRNAKLTIIGTGNGGSAGGRTGAVQNDIPDGQEEDVPRSRSSSGSGAAR